MKRRDLLGAIAGAAIALPLAARAHQPMSVIGYLSSGSPESETRSLQDAAHSLGLQAHVLRANTASEIDAAFGVLVELRAGALVVSGDTLFTSQRAQIVALAARHAVPAIYQWRQFAVAGGLMSYGPDLADTNRQTGVYTGKILKGAKPADLPIEQAVKVELVINSQHRQDTRADSTADADADGPRRRGDRMRSGLASMAPIYARGRKQR